MPAEARIPAQPAGGAAQTGGGPKSSGERSLRTALKRGWKRRCPNCGGGRVFNGYLTVRDACMTCGENLSHHRADDLPAWLTIIVVGHLVTPAMLLVFDLWAPPLWVHWTLWPTLTLALSLLLLPRFKAMVVALQWARRMGGFEARDGAV